MIKALIAGTFDILHPGHINLIKQAQNLGDCLVIVVARDQTVIKVKGRAPYFNEEQRLENLNNLLNTNLVSQISYLKSRISNFNIRDSRYEIRDIRYKIVLGDKDNPYKVINDEKPDIIALGYDQEMFVDGLEKWIRDTRYAIRDTRLAPFKENVCKSKNIRKAIEDSQSGFLLIDKPMDWTSHDAVAKLRSITGIKQIGHTGTLDPFATGLLICAVGQATKMVEIFNVSPKMYEATIRLGVVSDTYDRTGKIEDRRSKINVSESQIHKVLESFIGQQQQVPPMFSAKKVHGKKLYELARKGQIIERKPCEVEIYNLELLRLKNQISSLKEGQSFKIKVQCSAGTYIRTLAHDIGQKLGTGAILSELKRTAIGDFNVNQAVQLNQLTKDNYSEYLITPFKALDEINQRYFQEIFKTSR